MTVLIIGNGFDLNLGLPTSYGNYIESKKFKELLNKDSSLAKHLKNIYVNQGWADIENELIKYSKFISSAPSKMTPITKLVQYKKNFETQYTDLANQLILYLKTIDYKSINTNSLAYTEIKKLKKNTFKIINFNYTNSIKYILKKNGFSEEEAKNHIIHVHGSLDENAIVFGVQDKAKITVKHIFLKKAFNPVFKSINVNNELKNSTDLIFFGHSHGNTDHSYFKSFINDISYSHNAKGRHLKFFYYGKNGYKSLMIELDTLTNNDLTWLKVTNEVEFIDTKH